jgi:hypothetical protein
MGSERSAARPCVELRCAWRILPLPFFIADLRNKNLALAFWVNARHIATFLLFVVAYRIVESGTLKYHYVSLIAKYRIN